jgi:RHS repeat-associated protein
VKLFFEGVLGLEKSYSKSCAGKYRYGYQGKYAEKDEETGWNHFELREYDPLIGRWLVPDPYRVGWSPYISMANDPINTVDPDGGCPDGNCDDWWNGGDVTVLDEIVVTPSGSDVIKGSAPAAAEVLNAFRIRDTFYTPIESQMFQAFKNGKISQVTYAIDRYKLQGAARDKMSNFGKAMSELEKSRAAQRQTALEFVRGDRTINTSKVSNTRSFNVKGPLLKGASRVVIAYAVYSTVEHIHGAEDTGLAVAEEVGGWAGAYGGAKIGAGLGSFLGPVGTIVGGVAGGIVGYAVGSYYTGKAYRKFD